jgi:hypothetical protein
LLGLQNELLKYDISVPELQGTPEDIAAEKCRIAANMVSTNGSVVVGFRNACTPLAALTH